MAGKIVASTINDDTGVLATQNGMTGIAKAWVNYNGVTQTIRSSFNVSSVTRASAGTYQLNFTTAMPDVNYAVPVGGSRDAFGVTADHQIGVYGFSTTSISFACRSEGGAYVDFQFLTCAVLSS
jgi:hypothetical protein